MSIHLVKVLLKKKMRNLLKFDISRWHYLNQRTSISACLNKVGINRIRETNSGVHVVWPVSLYTVVQLFLSTESCEAFCVAFVNASVRTAATAHLL